MLQANSRLFLLASTRVQVGSPQAWVVGDAGRLSLDELPQERELQVVRHNVWRALDLALLHEQFEMGHDFVLQLLKPLVQLHVILIGTSVIILTSPSLSPIRLRELERTGDFAVECAVPVACLSIEANCENAWLHP